MLTIEAVPRTWSGVDFRSTLEADWAATLSSLNIDWVYEPKIVTLPTGERYIPDFHLPKIGTWLEVKGQDVPNIHKPRLYAKQIVCKCSTKLCECDWPCGEIVMIGLDPTEVGTSPRWRARRWLMRWEDALGGNVLLLNCAHCGAYSWIRPRHALVCRICRRRPKGGHLANSGERNFHHADRYG